MSRCSMMQYYLLLKDIFRLYWPYFWTNESFLLLFKTFFPQEDFLNCLLTKFHQNHSLIIQVGGTLLHVVPWLSVGMKPTLYRSLGGPFRVIQEKFSLKVEIKSLLKKRLISFHLSVENKHRKAARPWGRRSRRGWPGCSLAKGFTLVHPCL